MSLYAHQKRDNALWVVAFILIAVLLIGMVVLSVKVMDKDNTKTVGAFAFEIGGLDEAGKEINDTSCIRLKKAINVDGLEIKIAEDANVEYSVFFFAVDEEGNETFVSSMLALAEDFDATSIPADADICRVVIEPTMDAEVGIFEINTYAKELAISYNK